MYAVVFINYIFPASLFIGGIYLFSTAAISKKGIIEYINPDNRVKASENEINRFVIVRRIRAISAGILLIAVSIIFFLLSQGIAIF